MNIAAITNALVGLESGLLIDAPELSGLLNIHVLEAWRYEVHCMSAYSSGNEEAHVYRSLERGSYAYLRTNVVEGVVLVILNITQEAAANEMRELVNSEIIKGEKIEYLASHYGGENTQCHQTSPARH